jgi:hypothetical protein
LRVSVRALLWAGFSAGALSACAGRAVVSEHNSGLGGGTAECEQAEPDASSPATAHGGASGMLGSVPTYAAGTGGESDHAGTGDAGVSGDVGAGGALPEGEGGTGNVASAGGAFACPNPSSQFASEVLSHSFGGGQSFNQATGFPNAIFGPPAAGDPSSVVSLGNGGWVVLGFSGNAIVDGPGVDFTVFENPLPGFKELATIAVSDDARHWTEFPCTAPRDASDYGSCAGVGVVYSSPSNGIDPLDPALSGGDHYDLADIGVQHARYVRITDRVDLEGMAGVFDLDALAIVHAECP